MLREWGLSTPTLPVALQHRHFQNPPTCMHQRAGSESGDYVPLHSHRTAAQAHTLTGTTTKVQHCRSGSYVLLHSVLLHVVDRLNLLAEIGIRSKGAVLI